jgi:phosphoglycolate phosphatase-like HAD superfamily hydrolase
MRHPITRDRYEAVLFDMDGVITDTVSIHATGWRRRLGWRGSGSAGGTGTLTPGLDQVWTR